MQYYSKSRKSPFVFRYFRGPFGIVDAYLTPLNGPLYGVSTGRCLFVIFPLRSLLASQREPREARVIQVKRVKRTHKGHSRPRDQAHVRAARNHKSDTSILRRERIELIERELKTIQGLIRRHRRRHRVSFLTGKTCRAHHRLHDTHMQHNFRSCPFSTFLLNTPGA